MKMCISSMQNKRWHIFSHYYLLFQALHLCALDSGDMVLNSVVICLPFYLIYLPLESDIMLHCNSIITRSSGSTGKKARYIRDLFHKFSLRKQMPHPPSFGMGHQSVYLVYSYNTQTFHKSWDQ